MKRQLQIKDGIVRNEWIGSCTMPVPPDDTWIFLDVTETHPEAQVDMIYKAATDTFSPPPAPPKVLNYNEFIQLFTDAERTQFRTMVQTNFEAEDVMDLLKTAPIIPLKSPKVGALLTKLVNLGVITAARRTAIINS